MKTRLEEVFRELKQEVPELEAAAFAISWNLPVQPGICRAVMIGKPEQHPNSLLRLTGETLHLLQWQMGLLGSQASSLEALLLERARMLSENQSPPAPTTPGEDRGEARPQAAH